MPTVLPESLHKLVSALAGLFLLAGVSASLASDLEPLRSLGSPSFAADAAVSVDSLMHSSVSITITVPYAEMSWSRTRDGYASGLGFSVEFEPGRSDRLYGDAWERRLLVPGYGGTRDGRLSLVETRTFDVPPGRYRLRIHVRDLSTERESQAVEDFELENLAKLPVGFADLQLGIFDSLGTFLPVPDRSFGYDTDRLGLRVVSFDRREGTWPRASTLHWRVLDAESNLQAQGDTVVSFDRATQPVVMRPAVGELFIGDYTLELERIEGKSRWRTSRRFQVEESGPPHGRAFDTMLEALAYIAPQEEVDGMRKLTPEQQAEAWERFWRRRDPTPETPRNEFELEFFRRLHYADQHFQGFGNGWRSDMGRIYVKFGPPDQTESRPATSSTPPMEVWYYNSPSRRFVFADRDGFGRWILVTPSVE